MLGSVRITLTASCSVPGRSIDGAVLFGEILCVADPSAGISHQPVGGRVGESQPAEHMVIWGGSLLPGHPLGACFVVREGHHQLPSLEVTPQHKGQLLHPCYEGPCLHSNLQQEHQGGEHNVISAIISVVWLLNWLPLAVNNFTSMCSKEGVNQLSRRPSTRRHAVN